MRGGSLKRFVPTEQTGEGLARFTPIPDGW